MGRIVLPKNPAILLTNSDGNVYFMNEAAMTLLGEQAVDFIHEPLDWNLEDGAVVEFNDRRFRMDVMQCQSENCIFLYDLAQHEQLEQQIEQQQQEIEALRQQLQHQRELSLMKERVTTLIAHEFRTPLSLIGVKSNILHKRHLPEEKAVQYMRQIETQVHDLVDLLDNLAFMHQPATRAATAKPLSLDLKGMAESLLLHMANQHPQHIITFAASEQVAAVRVDHRLFRHVLSNLLSNALKHAPAGTQVRLEMQAATELSLAVDVQGVSITPDELREIMTPSHRSDGAQISGFNLGLAVIKISVEAYGGTFHIESHATLGTTIIVSLPCQPK
jgi:signal transduction histidine kinase